MQGTQRYVIFSFLTMGLVLWLTLARMFATIAYTAELPDPAILGNQFTLTNLLGMVIAIVAGVISYKNPRANEFSHDVVNELRKVTWPSRKDTQSHTVVVLITTLIIALILGLFDLVWSELTSLIYA